MSKFLVKAIFNGTSLTIPVSARTVDGAVEKVARRRLVKRASVLLVIDRRSGETRHVVLNGR